MTAATGVAAHNINGITVHSAFMLNDRKKAGTTYYNLGSDTLSTLQTQLEQLMVVIIDEISMIGAQTLYKIHMRLQEIKGLHYSNTRFGNVTIIAVGDLYQLPPLKDKKSMIRLELEMTRILYVYTNHYGKKIFISTN